MSKFWDGATRTTGAHVGRDGKKTARKIGVKGAWTLKARGATGVLVGGVFIQESEFSEKKYMDEKGGRANHLAICEHGRTQPASTRRVCIDLCKLSAVWCATCRKASEKNAAV